MQIRDIPTGELRGGGYLATPDGKGPHPGVVVIHEAFGLNEHIKDVTRRIAGAGYAALAVDLFAGQNRVVCMARFMAGTLRGSVNRLGVDDLKSALTHLANMSNVDSERLGAVGFCMGGGFAIAWACTDSRLKAIAPFYAANPRPIDVTSRLCPVVGSYPGQDFTARSGRALDGALTRFGIKHDIKVYPGTRHSFFNDTRSSFNREAANDSWSRLLKFFEEQLSQ
ncbi:MAG TPA: dienelactone hydrolase family protein [Candidatus Dormibacteraeota bacterium]|nr:dienelactone hydrolase family protein [Candidatus Dormibacteraeota bacterium]